MPDPISALDFEARIAGILTALGIPPELISQRGLQLQYEPTTLVVASVTNAGDAWELTPAACSAWRKMHSASAQDGVPMALVSAYRSVARQQEIIEAKLARGDSISSILASVAPPGYSEHHTGRAVDIGTSEEDALEEIFETTPAFAWLQTHAAEYGFVLTYPRNNRQGFVYEPWHWCWYGA